MGSCEWSCGPELVIRHKSQALQRWGKDQIPQKSWAHQSKITKHTIVLYVRHHSQSAVFQLTAQKVH